jgi:pimeloyl-ACP methyl ester carboxylesterase
MNNTGSLRVTTPTDREIVITRVFDAPRGLVFNAIPDPTQWPVLVAKVKKMGLEFKGFTHEEMKSIKPRVLITLGDRDGVRLEHAVEMFRLIPNAQLAVFPGGDHLLLFMSPDAVLSPIAAFLNAPVPAAR